MIIERTIAVRTHGRYLLELAEAPAAVPLIVGFHGYGEDATVQLERLRAVRRRSAWNIVALQGLHRFYNRGGLHVGASWMTREDRELMIEDNVHYVDHVIDAIAREFGEPSAIVHVGFSQGASMAYRAAALGARAAAGVIALGGDVPPELGDEALSRIRRVLVGWGVRDPFYTREKRERDEIRLRGAGADVMTAELDAEHAWTDAFVETAVRWIEPLA